MHQVVFPVLRCRWHLRILQVGDSEAGDILIIAMRRWFVLWIWFQNVCMALSLVRHTWRPTAKFKRFYCDTSFLLFYPFHGYSIIFLFTFSSARIVEYKTSKSPRALKSQSKLLYLLVQWECVFKVKNFSENPWILRIFNVLHTSWH